MSRLSAEDWTRRAAYVKQAQAARGATRAILAMYARHDERPGPRCGDCVHFLRERKAYRKCQAYGVTHGAATDWRASWTGCGLFTGALPDDLEPVA